MRWQPILRGETARRADAVINSIADTLARAIPLLRPETAVWHQGTAADFALFFGFLSAATKQREHRDLALTCLQLATESFASDAGVGLHGGLSGLAWTVRHLQGPPARLKIDSREICEPADEVLLQRLLKLEDSKQWADYDLISGLAGQGVYLLSSLPSRKAARALKLIIARLEATAKKMPKGIMWHTPAWVLPEDQREIAPRGYYNLGAAHGVPGLIGFLAEAYHRGVERKRTLRLLEGAVSFLIAQELPQDSLSLLPAWVAPGRLSSSCRVAWCYGDLGASVALLHAARKTSRHDWEAEALALARKAAQCPFKKSGVIDACLCHGAAGNGHLFNRLYQATGQEGFLTAARAYLALALGIHGSGKKLAGYSFWTSRGNSDEIDWGPDASFLSGITGLGLALLSATRPTAPDWDGLLLATS